MKTRSILTSRHNVARATRVLRAADEVLDALFKAREGSRLSQVLALASAAGSVLDAVVPERPPHDQLLDMGYKPIGLGLGEFFCELLLESDLERTQLQVSAQRVIVLWNLPAASSAVAMIASNDSYEAGPYVLGGKREFVVEALRNVVWNSNSDLMLDVARSEGSGRRPDTQSYVLQPLDEPGAYFGTPGLDWFVQRLARHEGETRSMMLVGPTGAGKSTLGRLIAREIDGGRLIKIGARVVKGSSVTDLVEIAEFLQPDVLLIDDISMVTSNNYGETGKEDESRMLELMEGLHGKARLVIATLMLEPGAGGSGHRGWRRMSSSANAGDRPAGNYFSGMRPGRVDEVVRIKRPSPAIRSQILTHYFGGKEGMKQHKVTAKILADMVKRTEGLTGAYLREVAHRVKTHGVKTYRGEIKSVFQHAPEVRGAAKRNARGIRRRRNARRKTVWEKRFDESQKTVELLEAKNEALSLKLKAKRAKK